MLARSQSDAELHHDLLPMTSKSKTLNVKSSSKYLPVSRLDTASSMSLPGSLPLSASTLATDNRGSTRPLSTFIDGSSADQPALQQEYSCLKKFPDVYETVTSLASIGGVKNVIVNIGGHGSSSPHTHHHKHNTLLTLILSHGGRNISSFYSLIIGLFGFIFPVYEALTAQWQANAVIEMFYTYLYATGAAFFIFLEVYVKRRRSHQEVANRSPSGSADAPLDPISPTSSNSLPLTITTYQSSSDQNSDNVAGQLPSATGNANQPEFDEQRNRSSSFISEQFSPPVDVYIIHHKEQALPHQTSLYLRIAAIMFGLGSLVYDGLLLTDIHTGNAECDSGHHFWSIYLHIIFLLTQTFFIFKHPQVDATSCESLIRLGFMHVMATNWCVWIRSLTQETLDSFLHRENSSLAMHTAKHAQQHQITANDTSNSTVCDISFLTPLVSLFFFPFVMEYSLLAVATMYSMYADVGKHATPQPSTKSDSEQNKRERKKHKDGDDDAFLNVAYTEINFHRSHRGLFLGLLMLAGVAISTVLYFIYIDSHLTNHSYVSQIIFTASNIMVTVIILSVLIFTVTRLSMLPLNSAYGSLYVDDVLLCIGASGAVLFSLFKGMPLIEATASDDHKTSELEIMEIVSCLLTMLLVLIQTPFIFQALRRETTTKRLWRLKPGRGCIMFLLVANLAMWVLTSFNMKQEELEGGVQESAYGFLAWQLIVHTCVPVLIFYHYHSSACLAYVWSRAYCKQTITDNIPKGKRDQQTNNSSASSQLLAVPSIQISNSTGNLLLSQLDVAQVPVAPAATAQQPTQPVNGRQTLRPPSSPRSVRIVEFKRKDRNLRHVSAIN